MTRVKICGLTNLEDAAYAADCGADFLGFIFVERSPRCIEPDKAKKIIQGLPPAPGKVGLFMNASLGHVIDQAKYCGIDHIQLHGDEDPGFCLELKKALPEVKVIKVFKVKENITGIAPGEYNGIDLCLFDTYHPEKAGGTGSSFNWNVIKDISVDRPFFIAGGLVPENVAEVVRLLAPYGVDVSSGVEEIPGKKDKKKIKEFIFNAKNA